ncbi:transglutaminase domain-containing protein [Streptomyces sp. NPDC004749]
MPSTRRRRTSTPSCRRSRKRWPPDARGSHEYAADRKSIGFPVHRVPRVTWRASDVLALRTGVCYAKAHALAALLRAESIPAALCYQRLAADDGTDPVPHGLVALRLPGRKTWHRQDPRGNKAGIDAQFSMDGERLAWTVREECNELDYPVLFDAPHPAVLSVLKAAVDRTHLWRTLPTSL